MIGLLVNFRNRWEVFFCAKQVCGEIQNLTPAQGARLALMTALYRVKMREIPVPDSMATINEMVQHPRAYRKELASTAFRLLRDMRQVSRDEIKEYASFKVSPDPKVTEHTKICDLTYSLLMSTVGVGCLPSTLDVVRFSWEQLATIFLPTAADIDLIMKMPEYIVLDIIEQPLETEEWLALAHQSPDFLKAAE